MNAAETVARHVELFNRGVRERNFQPMLEHFADDAELVFEGVPVGPFRGKPAIAAAYGAQPPDDELDVLDVRETSAETTVGYAWRREPETRAGEMRFKLRGSRIARLVVTFAP